MNGYAVFKVQTHSSKDKQVKEYPLHLFAHLEAKFSPPF